MIVLLFVRMRMLMVLVRVLGADVHLPHPVFVLRRVRVDVDHHRRRAGARWRHVDAEDTRAGRAADGKRLRCAPVVGQLHDDPPFGQGLECVEICQVDGEPRSRSDLERRILREQLRLVGPARHRDGLGLFRLSVRRRHFYLGGAAAEKNQDKQGKLFRIHGSTSAPIARSNSISANFAAAFSSSSRSCDCCATRKESISSRIPNSPSW